MNQTEPVYCYFCKEECKPSLFYDKEKTKPVDTGYSYPPDAPNKKMCFACSVKRVLQLMYRATECFDLYLIEKDKSWYLTDWSSTLVIGPVYVKKNGQRKDTWVVIDTWYWHGINSSRNDQCCKLRKTTGRQMSASLFPTFRIKDEIVTLELLKGDEYLK